jgi:hypothetical protein
MCNKQYAKECSIFSGLLKTENGFNKLLTCKHEDHSIHDDVDFGGNCEVTDYFSWRH